MSQRIPAGYRCDFSSCKSLLSLCCGLILGLCSMLCVASHVSATKDYPIDLWEGTDATGAGPTDTGQMAVGQLMPHPDEGQRELKLQDNEQFLKVWQPHAVPIQYFSSKLQTAQTFHDVFRIFYGEYLSNEDIEAFLISQRPHHPHHYRVMGRPRLGGLSPSHGYHVPSIQGTTSNHLVLPSVCDNCIHIPNAVIAVSPVETSSKEAELLSRRLRRDKRRRTEEKGRRKRIRDSRRRKKRENQKALSHVHEMNAKAQCHVPIKKVIKVKDAASSPNLEFFPECTIVYRCSEESGCCGETEQCVPKSHTTITRHFYVLRILHGTQSIPHSTFVQMMTFQNHTECICRPKPKLPQCLKCPHAVFQISRTKNMTCTCDCNMRQDVTCSKIKRGRMALSESKLTCIRSGQCQEPTCRYGQFDLSNGFCPRRGSAERKRPRTGLPITGEEIKLRHTNLSGKQ